jgi:hypothetical protein
MDNRELANSELSKVLDSGVVSIRNSKLNSISELPQSETPDETISSGKSVNNYNVVVNVSGNTSTQQPQIESKNIVNNILRNNTIESPQDIKKNYKETLRENSNLIPDNFTIRNENMNINSYPASFNYNNMILKNDELFANNDFSSKLQLLKTISNSANSESMQNLGADVSSISENSITNYSYSNADIKNKNNSLNMAFESINNVIQHSLGINGNLAGSILTNELNVDNRTEQLNIYKNNIEVKNQSTTTLEEMDNKIREIDRFEKIRSKMAERSVLQMAESNDRKQSEDIDLTNQMEDTSPISKEDYTPTPNKEILDRDISHINSDTDYDYIDFLNKMNSPPIWRTVLG